MPCIRIIYEIFPNFLWGLEKKLRKKTLKKLEEETPFFSRSYIVSRINYNLLSAKTCSATTHVIYFPSVAIAACAAASLAIGTRNGEHET